MSVLEQISENLMKGKAKEVKDLVAKAVAEKIKPADILNKGLLAGMSIIGERFKKNEVYVPEVLIAARAMKAGMEQLKPLLAAAGIQPKGTVVVGTVKGDLHDIGKNLVGMMLEGAGFEVTDLGSDVDAQKFVDAVKSTNAQVIGMSALLTTTMSNMPSTIEALKAAGLRDKVKVVVGGAPLTKAFADQIGADGYAPDASQAAKLALSFVS